MTDDDTDPLRPRLRPGVRVHAEAATWESTVFAVSVGGSVRYLEVPADQVADFLAAVDAGALDDDLVSLATTPTGATLNLPGRVRRLAAFDRLVRAAIARAERDPVTGHLTETGWRPRKRRRDEQDQSQSEQSQADQHPDTQAKAQSDSAAQHGAQAQPVAASTSTGAPVASSAAVATAVATAATTAAKAGWWSSPMVVAGAAAAVVVIAAGSIFVVTRSSGDAATAAPAVATASPAEVASATGSGGLPTTASNGSSGSAAEPAASITANSVTATADTTGPPASEATGASSGGAGAGSAVSLGSALSASDTAAASAVVPPASGPVNPFAGSYGFTRTVTDNSGNPDFAVGSGETGTLTLTADCADPGCGVTGDGWGPAAVSGSQLTFGGTSSEPCTDPPGISVTDSWSVTLNADGPVAAGAPVTSLQGVGTVTVSALNGCNATIAPITWSYALTRTG